MSTFSDEKIVLDDRRAEHEANTSPTTLSPAVTASPLAITPSTNMSKEDKSLTSRSRNESQAPRSNDTDTLSSPPGYGTATEGDKMPIIEPDPTTAPERVHTSASLHSTPSTTHPPARHHSQSRARSYREHAFYHATAWKMNHNIVVDPNNHATHFIQVSPFAKGKEDVIVHAVPPQLASQGSALTPEQGKSCARVAFARFPHGKTDVVSLGVGDPEVVGRVRWFALVREVVGAGEGDWLLRSEMGVEGVEVSRPRFRLLSSAAAGDGGGAGAMATSPASTDLQSPTGTEAKLAPGSFRFVDAVQATTLAVYNEYKALASFKKRGKLRLYDGAFGDSDGVLGEQDVELLIVLCCAVLNEKRRRKTLRKWTGFG
jgi:hypothetical protein